MKAKRKLKITKLEKIIYTIAIITLVLFPGAIVFAKSSLSEINYRVEKVKKNIETQIKTNESLEMKINELVSLDNIEDIIKKEGLSYNNDNIKNIKNEKVE